MATTILPDSKSPEDGVAQASMDPLEPDYVAPEVDPRQFDMVAEAPMKRQSKGYIDPRRIATINAILDAMPGTQKAIAARSGAHRATVSKLIRRLHADGNIHIIDWISHPVRGPYIPVYSKGPGEDAIDDRPRLTRREISERFEQRIKGTDKGYARRAKNRAWHWTKKAKAKPSNWASVLFVAAEQRRAAA